MYRYLIEVSTSHMFKEHESEIKPLTTRLRSYNFLPLEPIHYQQLLWI